MAANAVSPLGGRELVARYDCPVVTAHGRMLLCELDYSGRPAPTIPLIDTFHERHDMWLLKKYGLPWLYWNVLLRGKKIPFTAKHRAAPSFEPVSA